MFFSPERLLNFNCGVYFCSQFTKVFDVIMFACFQSHVGICPVFLPTLYSRLCSGTSRSCVSLAVYFLPECLAMQGEHSEMHPSGFQSKHLLSFPKSSTSPRVLCMLSLITQNSLVCVSRDGMVVCAVPHTRGKRNFYKIYFTHIRFSFR